MTSLPTGQTIYGHRVFIPDSRYAIGTGDSASGPNITLVSSATNRNSFHYGRVQVPAARSRRQGPSSVGADARNWPTLRIIGLENSFALAILSSPISPGANKAIFDSFIAYMTINGTIVATITARRGHPHRWLGWCRFTVAAALAPSHHARICPG
jgi:hypothetical protein